jgi:hypothetical protein
MIHRSASLLVCAATAALSAQGQEPAVLPITRVVLYKGGIGYFEHIATVTGNQSLAVQFTGDQLDDVLKSLTAVDLATGASPASATTRRRRPRGGCGPSACRLRRTRRHCRCSRRSADRVWRSGRMRRAGDRPRPARGTPHPPAR